MNFMPFGQLKSFLKILIEVQYDEIGKSCERGIFRPIELSKTEKYFVYFPLSIPKSGRKRSAHSRR